MAGPDCGKGAEHSGRQGHQEQKNGVQLIPLKAVQAEATSYFTHVHTHSPSSVDHPAISLADWARLHCLPLAASASGRVPGCGVARDEVGALNINNVR